MSSSGHSAFQRLNQATALATTVLITLLCAISLTTFLIPNTLDPASLKINNLNVVLGRSNSHWERNGKAQEFTFAKFDLMADLTPLFNWNTKQVFVYLLADYSTPGYPDNQVVIWDRIVRGKRYAKVNLADAKQKYEFKEISKSFRNVTATFSLKYEVQPHVGLLTRGEVTRTEPIKFPSVHSKVA